jgi:hypothetical protein
VIGPAPIRTVYGRNVAGEVALAVVVLFSTGLMIRTILFLDQQVDVAVDLVGELALDAVPAEEIAEEVAETGSRAFEERHHVPSASRKARAIATEIRPQFGVSALSCRRPAVVSR